MVTDLVGNTYGQLTVIRMYKQGRRHFCNCTCSCGNSRILRNDTLLRLDARAMCTECVKLNQTPKHGERYTVEYQTYYGARRRCTAISDISYPNYGGRGIEFRFASYQEFLLHLGRRPTPQHSIERIDNEGHYEKGNVRWATTAEQHLNRRNLVLVTYKGETKPIAEWCRQLNIKYHRTKSRLRSGWNIERALEEQPRHEWKNQTA